jgi:hypothetical protein
MRRKIGMRARTDFPVIARDGTLSSRCRGVEVSPSGIVIDRGKPIGSRHERLVIRLELRLPERVRPVIALARPIWSFGTQQALRFVRISDVDRLTLAEHADLVGKRGALLN